jgi:hypothetical protein
LEPGALIEFGAQGEVERFYQRCETYLRTFITEPLHCFRMALTCPERVQAMIVPNAVSHEEGVSPFWAVRRSFWQDRPAHEAEVRSKLLSLEATRKRHIGTSPDPALYDPDLWVDENYFLNRPGQGDIQLDLFFDYQNNLKSYPKWQQWLCDSKPPVLVLLGALRDFVHGSRWRSVQEG